MEWTIDVKALPNASRTGLAGMEGGVLRIRVAAPPDDGKANRALQVWLAEHLGVAKSQVAIIRGEHHRRKVIRVSGLEREAGMRLLGDGH